MKFSRHSKQHLKLYNLNRARVEAVVTADNLVGKDERGNLIYEAANLRVIVAHDDTSFIITTFPTDD